METVIGVLLCLLAVIIILAGAATSLYIKWREIERWYNVQDIIKDEAERRAERKRRRNT